MELKGKIKIIGDIQTFDSGFKKREAIITTLEKFPQDIKVEFAKEKADLLNNCKVGEDITVAFNLRGQEYQGKYYVSLSGWKITKDESAPEDNSKNDMGKDDLPF
jgi:single-strand DNA-binding protein